MEQEGIIHQILKLIKDSSSIPHELSIEAVSQIHSKKNTKDFIITLHEMNFFNEYLSTRSTLTYELSLFSIAVLTHSEQYYTESIFNNQEELLINLFNSVVPTIFIKTKDYPAVNSISDVAFFFIMCIDRPRESKLCQHILGYASLSSCLYLSKQGMKQFLLKHINEIPLWKTFLQDTMNFYLSPQALFVSEMLKAFWVGFRMLEKGGLVLCQSIMQLLIALVQNPKTSPYAQALIKDNQLLVIMKLSKTMEEPIGALLDKQRDLLKFYMSCSQMSKEELWEEENEKLSLLFKVFYSHFGEDFSKSTSQLVGKLNSKENLDELLEKLPSGKILSLCQYLNLSRPPPELIESVFGKEVSYDTVLKEIIKDNYDDTQRVHKFTEIVTSSLYPNEEILWDIDELPYKYKQSTELALPYISFWCTSFEDLLSRFYWLYRLDAAYYMRADLEEVIEEYKENKSAVGALEVKRFTVKYVKPALVGMNQPAEVRAEIEYSLNDMSEEQKNNWGSLEEGDTLFLVSFDSSEKMKDVDSEIFQSKYSIKAIRGCEISRIYDGDGNKLLNVFLDPFQYKEDLESPEQLGFHLLVRKGKSINKFFKVLKSVRELMVKDSILPKFVEDVIIHGKLGEERVNEELLKKVVSVLFESEDKYKEFYLRNETLSEEIKSRLNPDIKLLPELYSHINIPEKHFNALIEMAGTEHRMSVVSGMPNSGKTNFCLSLATVLIKANPQERVIFLTNTKDALESTFKQLLDSHPINERYICALGITKPINNKSLTQRGRIDHLLTQRLILLNEVKILADSLEIRYAEEYTCDSALNLFKLHLIHKWEEFLTNVEVEKGVEGEKKDSILRLFPFTRYFVRYEEQLFIGNHNEDLAKAKLKWKQLQELFSIIKETKVLEIIRDDEERERCILSTHVKFIGMTTKFLTTNQTKLTKLGLTYSTLIIDDAGMSPLWESVLAISLSKGIKRIILASDVNQTPIFTLNNRFKELTRLNRSLFEIALSLGVSQYELSDAYGLKDSLRRFRKKEGVKLTTIANVGFGYDCQWVNVVEANPIGEVVNVDEAEYIAATYFFMCIVGYHAKDIAIVCATKEQKDLVKEIIEVKGIAQGIISQLPIIKTVSKFQGLTNKILLISLVRANSRGMFKDPRRFKHLITQAKDGFYIFGNLQSYKNLWTESPRNLVIIPKEDNSTTRTTDNNTPEGAKTIENYEEMYQIINSLITKH